MSDEFADAGSEDPSAVDTSDTPPFVRSATPDDLPRLLALQAVAFPDPHRTLLRNGVRAGLALVATGAVPDRSGQGVAGPVGYALFTADGGVVHVAELAVGPAHRRRGHGRRLLAAVAARHPDHGRLQLTTRVDNEAARAFYASLGFEEADRLPGHYDGAATDESAAGAGGDPTDGLLLVRRLE